MNLSKKKNFFAKYSKKKCCILNKIKTCGSFFIKWRYLIALVVFIFCVVFKLHGSSISEYNLIFNNSSEYNAEEIIFGESRSIRSDEWLVHTPYYMSQIYNNFEKYSNMMSIDGQDMIVGYNAPVIDVTVIAKPFTWGYILFGNEYGLSWYWCSKLILLILVSFELCMIVTKKNKKLSVFGAFLIAFAPSVQWFFVPHMVDVFFWGMSLMVLAYHFFTSQKLWKLLFACLLSLSTITFIIALFPSLQISIGLAMLALLVATLVRDKKDITFKKKNIWQLILIILFVTLILCYTVITSKDAIFTLYNTVYPGARTETGGNDQIKTLFTDLVTFLLPYKDITYSNNSEVSTFIHFAPVFMALYPIIRKKLKKDKNIIVGDALIICLAVMATFMLAGFPELLAKITLFSYINRMKTAYGLVATIFTVWGIDMIWKEKIFSKKQILITILVYCLLYVCFIGKDELTYMNWWYYGVVIVGLATLVYLMLNNNKKIFIAGMMSLIIISGATINPVAHGISAITSHPLEQKIHEIAAGDSDAYWITEGNITLSSLAVANGAKTINMTNFYPDFGKWRILDPDGNYDDVYNRYAHIIIQLTDEDTSFSFGNTADQIFVKINYNMLDNLHIKYILTTNEISGDRNYEKIYQDTEGEYYIYERIEE